MPSYNKVILMGNLTRDPEIREAGSSQVCSFSIAVNRKWRKRDGDQQEEVTFVDCECWGKTAEIVAKYLEKGSAVHLDGRLKLDVWEDKDGSKRSKMRVVAENVGFLNGPSSERSEPSQHQQDKSNGYQPQDRGPSVPPPAGPDDTDVPF